MSYDLRFALRMILAHRWFSLAVVVTLALGIGLNTMIFTIVNAALFKPVPVPGGDRLVSIATHTPDGRDRVMSYPYLLDIRAQAHSFEAIEAGANQEGVLGEPGIPPQSWHLMRVTSGIFSMVHIHPIQGRDFLPSDAQPGAAPVLMIGYNVWQERYAGSPSVIGRQVRVNEKPATIIGVMPRTFGFPTVIDLWMPLVPTADDMKRDNRQLQVFAILRPDVKMAAAQTEIHDLSLRIAAQESGTDKDTTANVMTFHERYNGGNIKLVFLLMLASVGFVLLIACANVANMMLSRAIGRQREMSLRAALGASRWRVVRQLLIESVTLSVLGGALGLVLGVLGVRWFNLATANVGKPYWVQFTMDYTVFGYFAALCILSGLAFGIAPALRASRPDLNQVLQDGARTIGRHRGGFLAATLVVFQFALTVVLLTGAGIFVHSLLKALEVNRSIPTHQIMVARIYLPDERYKDTDARQRFYDQLLPRLQAIPGVTRATIVSNPPGLGSADTHIEIEHGPVLDAAHRPPVSFVVASPGYLQTIQLPLLRGRDFNDLDGTAGHLSAVVTRETAERFWPGRSALGKRFRLFDDKGKAGDWITVIGVSANIVQDVNTPNPNPLLFQPFRQVGWDSMSLVVESSTDPTKAVSAAVQSLDQDLPLRDTWILSGAIEHNQWYLHLFSKIFMGFALIALLMAAVGIYAVLAQATGRRTQEIGVRIALGASFRNIMLLVMRRGLWQIVAGLTLGLAAAFPAARVMASLPIGVSPTDPVVFIAVAGTLALVGVIACWLPARRAAHLDPVQAIRYE